MSTTMSSGTPSTLSGAFLEEYSTNASVRKYTKATAGTGISYLLDHDYGQIYLEVLEKYVPKARTQKGVRLWEFGCGGGMNLVHLVSVLERRGIPVDCAYGTDFSPRLLEAANREAQTYLTADQRRKVRFAVARNEHLIEDVTTGVGINKEELLGSFDLVFGVNTIRYCHRLKNENACVQGIFDLLGDHGVSVIIDMNNKFPVFRSRVRDWLTKEEQAYRLPSLDDHARPFAAAGFEVLKKEHFCWIPHSAGPGLTRVMKALTPVLGTLAPDRAMRSLVVSRKHSNGGRSL